jgi:hypothetical protein
MKLKIDLRSLNTFTYSTYQAMIQVLMAAGKTTGQNHSEAMLGHTTMNIARMNRLDKKAEITEELSAKLQVLPKQTWLIISEAWCGDAAQNLPWIIKMAERSKHIDVAIVLRDENEELMDLFLTNGSQSIPKLIALDQAMEVLYTWGPRPKLMEDTRMALKTPERTTQISYKRCT